MDSLIGLSLLHYPGPGISGFEVYPIGGEKQVKLSFCYRDSPIQEQRHAIMLSKPLDYTGLFIY